MLVETWLAIIEIFNVTNAFFQKSVIMQFNFLTAYFASTQKFIKDHKMLLVSNYEWLLGTF